MNTNERTPTASHTIKRSLVQENKGLGSQRRKNGEHTKKSRPHEGPVNLNLTFRKKVAGERVQLHPKRIREQEEEKRIREKKAASREFGSRGKERVGFEGDSTRV